MNLSMVFQEPTVANLPLDSPLICTPDSTVSELANAINHKKVHCVLIFGGDNLLKGIVTTKDIAFSGLATENLCAKDIMTNEPVIVDSKMLVSTALELMVTKKIRHLPIQESGSNAIIGILDITKCFHQAMLKLEKLAMDNVKLNDVVKDVIQNDSVFEKNLILESISKLVQLMENPKLETILNTSSYTTTPVIASPSTTVSDALALMKKHTTTAILVRDSAPKHVHKGDQSITAHVCVEKNCTSNYFNIIGIFTSKDIVNRVLSSSEVLDPETCTLTRVMTTRPNYAPKDLGIHSALRMMYDGHYLNLPVIDECGSIVGLISVLQLTHAALSCQLSKNSKRQKNIEESFVHVTNDSQLVFSKKRRSLSYNTSCNNLGGSVDYDISSNPLPEKQARDVDDYSWKYFWRSFDTSDNEGSVSTSSSQLSLSDPNNFFPLQPRNDERVLNTEQEHSQLINVAERNVPYRTQSQNDLSLFKRSSNLLERDFFEKTIPRKQRFKVEVFTKVSSSSEETFLKTIKVSIRNNRSLKADYVYLYNNLYEKLSQCVDIDIMNTPHKLLFKSDTHFTFCILSNPEELKNVLEARTKKNEIKTTIPLILRIDLTFKKHTPSEKTPVFQGISCLVCRMFDFPWVKISFAFLFGLGLGKWLY